MYILNVSFSNQNFRLHSTLSSMDNRVFEEVTIKQEFEDDYVVDDNIQNYEYVHTY